MDLFWSGKLWTGNPKKKPKKERKILRSQVRFPFLFLNLLKTMDLFWSGEFWTGHQKNWKKKGKSCEARCGSLSYLWTCRKLWICSVSGTQFLVPAGTRGGQSGVLLFRYLYWYQEIYCATHHRDGPPFEYKCVGSFGASCCEFAGLGEVALHLPHPNVCRGIMPTGFGASSIPHSSQGDLVPGIDHCSYCGEVCAVLFALNHHWHVQIHFDCQSVVDIGNQMLACRKTGASFPECQHWDIGVVYGNTLILVLVDLFLSVRCLHI